MYLKLSISIQQELDLLVPLQVNLFNGIHTPHRICSANLIYRHVLSPPFFDFITNCPIARPVSLLCDSGPYKLHYRPLSLLLSLSHLCVTWIAERCGLWCEPPPEWWWERVSSGAVWSVIWTLQPRENEVTCVPGTLSESWQRLLQWSSILWCY